MNEQDPLAQLRDIHMPEPAGWWPPAPGWWLLAFLVLACLAVTTWLLYRQHQRNAYRRSARRELEAAWATLAQDGNRQAYIESMTRILRRAARVADPRAAHLHGERWLEFLDSSTGGSDFSRGTGRDLLTLPYRPPPEDLDLQALHEVVMKWLSRHRRTAAGQWEAGRVAV